MKTVPVQIKNEILDKLNQIVMENREFYTIQSFLRYLIELDIEEKQDKEKIEKDYKLINIVVNEEVKERVFEIVKDNNFFITTTSYINFLIYKYLEENKNN